jgi:hypothetical protein
MKIEIGEKIFREFHFPSRLVDANDWQRDLPNRCMARRVVYLENPENPPGVSRIGAFEMTWDGEVEDGTIITVTCDLGGRERWLVIDSASPERDYDVVPFHSPTTYTDYEVRLFDHALGFLLVNFAPEDVASLGDPQEVHKALEALHEKVAEIGD